MKLKPPATNPSSSRWLVASSAVQPNTLPPRHSGATRKGDWPSCRFSMRSLLIFVVGPDRAQLVHRRDAVGDLHQGRRLLHEPGIARPPRNHHRDIEVERGEALAQHPGLAGQLRGEIAP